MYFHAIIRKKDSFDTVDFPYCTGVAMSGSNIVVTYANDNTLSPSLTANYPVTSYNVYVIPKSEV